MEEFEELVVHDPGGFVPFSLAVLATIIVAVLPMQPQMDVLLAQPGRGSPVAYALLGMEGPLAVGRRGSVPAQLTIYQCNVQTSANVVFHAAHEAGKESTEHQ